MFLSAIFACGTPAPTSAEALPTAPLGPVTGFEPDRDRFVAHHPPMGSTSTFSDDGIQVSGESWELMLRPVSMSRDATSTPLDITGARLEGQRVESGSDPLFWATHGEEGLEFGFDLMTRPQGEGDLVIRLDYAGQDMPYSMGTDVSFDTGTHLLHIDHLVVTDAEGAVLRSWMSVMCDPTSDELDEAIDCHLAIEIDDQGALYPLLVDPLVTTSPRIVSPRAVVVGDPLVITEIMANPHPVGDAAAEWFEIMNTGTTAIDLSEMEIWDNGNNCHSIPAASGLSVPPGGVVLLGRSANLALNGGIVPDYIYSGFHISNNPTPNNPDEVIIGNRSCNQPCNVVSCDIVDEVVLTTAWEHEVPGVADFLPIGASLSLDDGGFLLDNNDPDQWCDGFAPFGIGQFGSPGEVNPSCGFILPFQYSFDLATGETIDGCTNVNPWVTQKGRMTTNNAGDGDYQRYTRTGGQTLTWSYDYQPPGTITPTTYRSTRSFNTPSWSLGTILGYDTAFADPGATWFSPCSPMDTGDTSDTALPPSESLIFTQYIEGPSNDKYLEIQNQGTADADLTGCLVNIYFNGNTSPGQAISIGAGSPLVIGDTLVLCHNQATPIPMDCDLITGNLEFNGNDVVELSCNNDTVDIIGQIGDNPEPPGFWGVAPLNTEQANLRRICGDPADSDGTDPYDTVGHWTSVTPIDDLSDLGTGSCP